MGVAPILNLQSTFTMYPLLPKPSRMDSVDFVILLISDAPLNNLHYNIII